MENGSVIQDITPVTEEEQVEINRQVYESFMTDLGLVRDLAAKYAEEEKELMGRGEASDPRYSYVHDILKNLRAVVEMCFESVEKCKNDRSLLMLLYPYRCLLNVCGVLLYKPSSAQRLSSTILKETISILHEDTNEKEETVEEIKARFSEGTETVH